MLNSKKILGICVSSRKHGNSSIILNELLRPAKEAGYEVEVMNLGELKILPCCGCFACSNSFKCILKDDLEQIKNKIIDADAIALSSPCYYLSAPSPLKAIMDRLASWAINEMANNIKNKFGVSVSVAGGSVMEFSLQRIFTSQFLGLFNCEITGQLTIEHTFNKGELLLTPSKLSLVSELGNNLKCVVESGQCIKSPLNECKDKLVCPHCLVDSFQIYKDGRVICPVCGAQLDFKKRNIVQEGFNRFSAEGAQEHRAHIVDNVIRGILANDEISKRQKKYWEFNVLPKEDYQVDMDLSGIADSVEWSPDAIKALKAKIPTALNERIKKAINKKAIQNGIAFITEDLAYSYLPKF